MTRDDKFVANAADRLEKVRRTVSKLWSVIRQSDITDKSEKMGRLQKIINDQQRANLKLEALKVAHSETWHELKLRLEQALDDLERNLYTLSALVDQGPGWARGMAAPQKNDDMSLGWPEGVAHERPQKSAGYAQGLAHQKVEHTSRGWAEGYDKNNDQDKGG